MTEGILKVYQAVEEALPARHCTGQAQCCRFVDTGRTPYVTDTEMALLLAHIRAQGRSVPRPREDGACPVLNADGMTCSAYAARPLGCRTHYCRQAGGPVTARQMRQALHGLAALEEARAKHSPGRPLTRALEDVRRSSRV